jgi:hypothetical protein
MRKWLFLVLLIACNDGSTCVPPDASHDSNGCPTSVPHEGDPCCPINLVCGYTCWQGDPSEWTCQRGGKWTRTLTLAIACKIDLGSIDLGH